MGEFDLVGSFLALASGLIIVIGGLMLVAILLTASIKEENPPVNNDLCNITSTGMFENIRNFGVWVILECNLPSGKRECFVLEKRGGVDRGIGLTCWELNT